MLFHFHLFIVLIYVLFVFPQHLFVWFWGATTASSCFYSLQVNHSDSGSFFKCCLSFLSFFLLVYFSIWQQYCIWFYVILCCFVINLEDNTFLFDGKKIFNIFWGIWICGFISSYGVFQLLLRKISYSRNWFNIKITWT